MRVNIVNEGFPIRWWPNGYAIIECAALLVASAALSSLMQYLYGTTLIGELVESHSIWLMLAWTCIAVVTFALASAFVNALNESISSFRFAPIRSVLVASAIIPMSMLVNAAISQALIVFSLAECALLVYFLQGSFMGFKLQWPTY
jgi:hypothetical protein